MRVTLMPFVVAALTAGVVACQPETKSRTTSVTFGAAQLVTASDLDRSTNRQVPRYHILFVPDVDPPNGGFGISGSAGETGDDVQLRYVYHEPSLRIRAEPVHIRDRKTVDAGGRSFQLVHGNVFIANVSRQGAIAMTQLPPMPHTQDIAAESVLEYMKKSQPANARLQAIQPRR